ncbi:DUF6542 domain-containing protein [Mycobacterium asiaticum]|uniref:DUF6542 domain-containing protein n=1 Tax=Mycobacterium asiaticum TaxID=1790 RepID=UPI00055F4EFF|nr:DUF6542 domain-containing protein [Mycobacterium asiaticum]ORA10606.1 hypothetical protein BST16_21655 [Mycobacterium asiaticum DSM 44297]
MSAQRESAAAEPSHRSIVPNIPGVPWWAAVLIAVGATAVGYAIDAGQKELTHVFAGFYIAGCVVAVLAVRQAAVFTAVIQPPLILFCSVPGAYWLFHGGKVDKFKDLLINCGYPLIERFPLMLGTAGGVLLLGMIRWYFGKNSPSRESKAQESPASPQPSWFRGVVAKFTELLTGEPDDGAEAAPAHGRDRTARSSRTARSNGRSAQRPARSRNRHARPDETYEPGAERPRRSTRRSSVPPADYDSADPPRPRRRRPPEDPDLGALPPREMRREPHSRRNNYERSYERSEPRSRRFNPYETYDRPEPPERTERPERRSRHERRPSYEPYEPYEPPYEPRRRRAAGNGASNGNSTHHPISQVRYRGQPPRNDPRDEPGRRSRSRTPRRDYPEYED